jgi:TldD protein
VRPVRFGCVAVLGALFGSAISGRASAVAPEAPGDEGTHSFGEGKAIVQDSPIRVALMAELERNKTGLSLPGAPPLYHLRYLFMDLRDVSATASHGEIVDMDDQPLGVLGVDVRVGSAAFDNTGFGGWETGFQQTSLPVHLTPRTLQQAAWRATDWAYKEAVEQYARKKATFQPPADYPGDFEVLPPTVARSDYAAADSLDAVMDLARRVSASMPTHPVPKRSAVLVAHEAGGFWVADTDGDDVSQPMSETVVRAVAHFQAPDGLLLTDHRTWMVRRLADLPAVSAMAEEARAMTAALVGVAAAAPLQEEYVGPVLFEGEATLDLFRVLLASQLEGTPPPVPFESQFGPLGNTFAPPGSPGDVRIGRRVLPLGWAVVDDPRRDMQNPASFAYDLEGTPARAVSLVTDGIVRTLLMSRTPRKGVEGTNGHARGAPGARAAGRVAMMEVTPEHRTSRHHLQRAAVKLAASYGRDWVMVVRRFQDDAIRALDEDARRSLFRGEETSGLRLPEPLYLSRLYADGHEVPVRGAAFSGVNRFVLRDIVAAGQQVAVNYLAPFHPGEFEGNPLSGLSTWLSAPEVLVGEMELLPTPSDPRDLPVVPAP